MYGQPMYGQPMMQPMMQPVMMAPPPPPVQQGPTIITIGNNNNDNGGSHCSFCGTNTQQFPRKKVGCTAILWGLCLLWTTGFLCCIPCCMDGCKDTELICAKCQQVKQTIPANCC